MTQYHHPVTAVNDGLFNSISGIVIDLNNPTLEMICIDDIASSLSKICRFGGHCREFYSVAQHSVLVSRMALEDYKLEGLLHDAPEAYLGDVIKPLKVILEYSGLNAYGEVEDKFADCICRRYGLTQSNLRYVKLNDITALELEFEYLVKGERGSWDRYMQGLGMPLYALPPAEAEALFLAEYSAIMSRKLGTPITDIL